MSLDNKISKVQHQATQTEELPLQPLDENIKIKNELKEDISPPVSPNNDDGITEDSFTIEKHEVFSDDSDVSLSRIKSLKETKKNVNGDVKENKKDRKCKKKLKQIEHMVKHALPEGTRIALVNNDDGSNRKQVIINK